MIFFPDENFPRAGKELLQQEGHIVYDIRGTEDEGMSDADIFNLAQDKGAIFVTTDKDFFHTIPFQRPEHNGIIVFNLRQPNRENLIEKLKWVLKNVNLADFYSRILLLRDATYILTESISNL